MQFPCHVVGRYDGPRCLRELPPLQAKLGAATLLVDTTDITDVN
jgi:hypothetical protein